VKQPKLRSSTGIVNTELAKELARSRSESEILSSIRYVIKMIGRALSSQTVLRRREIGLRQSIRMESSNKVYHVQRPKR